MNPSRSLPGLAALLLALTLARPAAACSPPCSTGFAAPAEGTIIPAGAPALSFRAPAGLAGRHDSAVSLRFSNGTAIPVTLATDPSAPDHDLIVPAHRLALGSYRLDYAAACGASASPDGGVPGAASARFDVGEAAPTSATVGTLRSISAGLATLEVATASGSCTTFVQGAQVSVAVAPSAELYPWLPLTRFSLLVDGIEWATTDYGGFVPGGLARSPAGGRTITQVFAVCGGSASASDDHGLPEGRHHLVLLAHVAGAASGDDPAPASLDVTLTCSGVDVVTSASGGGPGRGCSLGAAPRDAMLPALAIALILIAQRRQRRRAAAPAPRPR